VILGLEMKSDGSGRSYETSVVRDMIATVQGEIFKGYHVVHHCVVGRTY
jgi:hypothetical protein